MPETPAMTAPTDLPAGVSQHVRLDVTKSLAEGRDGGHNRWHASVPPLLTVQQGELVALDVRDSSDAQVAEDRLDAGTDLDRLHPLTGPIHVEGAMPGDLLEVEIVDVAHADRGWSGVYPGGGGVMRDAVREPRVILWSLVDGIGRSEGLPGVAVPADPFIGVIGVAPCEERRAAIAARERRVVERGGEALQPSGRHAMPDDPRVAAEGLRTLPPRELGGNLDARDLTAGSRIYLPVDVPGALLSLGDLHFAQGDGESYGTAIEVSGRVCLRCRVHCAEDVRWSPRFPVIRPAQVAGGRNPRPTLMTLGMPHTDDGEVSYSDVTLATQRALGEMAEYLQAARGYDANDAYAIVTVAGDLRISVIANAPSPVVAVALPLDVLEREERWLSAD